MRLLYLLPQRAIGDPNTMQIADTLSAAGHDIAIIGPNGRTRVGGILNLMYRAPGIAARGRPDAILCRDLDTLAAGVRAKRRTGAKLVYWAHDIYQDMIREDVPRRLLSWLDQYEQKLLPSVDTAIAANDGVRQHLMERCLGLFPARINLCRVPEVYFAPPGARKLCYFGTFHENRFIREMVEAMPAIREGFDDPKPTLTIAGPRDRYGIYDWLKKEYGCGPEGFYGDEAVMFLGTLTPDDVLFQTYESDIIVSMLNPEDPCLRVGLSNKVFDAMAIGRAAIGTHGTATGDLIAEAGMGYTPPYRTDMYVAAVRHMLREGDTRQMGINAYQAGREKYNWYKESEKLLALFQEMR